MTDWLDTIAFALWAAQFAYSAFNYGQEGHFAWLVAAIAQGLLTFIFFMRVVSP